MELDHTLTSRDVINSKITAILDEATDKWGIKVNRVEVKNIIPPREIQEAMEKQMKAERETPRRHPEGRRREAGRHYSPPRAKRKSAILRADAVKQQRILEAEGEAQAILAVQKANADAIRLLNEAMPNDKVLALRSLEALAKVANGKATKIIIPSELAESGRRCAQHQGADDRPERRRLRGSYDLRYPEQSPQLSGPVRAALDSVIEFRHGAGHQQPARRAAPASMATRLWS